MGTIISLDLSSLELVSSKNSRGMDHGALFQAADRKPYRTATSMAPASEEEEPLGDADMAFVRTLKDVLPRLELLGNTLGNAEAAHDRWVATWLEDREALRDDLDLPEVTPLTFEEFRAFVVRHAVTDLDDTYLEYGTDKARVKGRFSEGGAHRPHSHRLGPQRSLLVEAELFRQPDRDPQPLPHPAAARGKHGQRRDRGDLAVRPAGGERLGEGR